MSGLPVYDAALLERARHPFGAGELPQPRASARATNPVCGDEVELDVRVGDGHIAALAHRVRGCAIVSASASLLTETLPGRTPADAIGRAQALRDALTGGCDVADDLALLRPLRMFPSRARCALLPWEALVRAIG